MARILSNPCLAADAPYILYITQNNNLLKRFFKFNRETKSFLALHWCGGALVVIRENSLLMGRDMLYVANASVGRSICFT